MTPTPEDIKALVGRVLKAEARAIAADKRLAEVEAERDKLRAAVSWIEYPFVNENTSIDELRQRVVLCVTDAKRAALSASGPDVVKETARRCVEIAREFPNRDPAEDGNGYWAAEEIAGKIAREFSLEGGE